MKLAVLMLCHESPVWLAARLRSPFYRHPDVKLYIHYDGARSANQLARLRESLPDDIAVEILDDRVTCAWGEYSLVEATRRLLARAGADTEFKPDYLMLVSGSCVPLRPAASLLEFLRRRRGMEFIEATDIAVERWVRDGLEEERFRYHFPFNYQTQRRRFDLAVDLQRRLGVYRVEPEGLRVHFGSQWFCLTRETAAEVVEGLARPDWVEFFRRSWIPDEFAIQTLVACRRPGAFIARHTLTYTEFDEQGKPLVLEDGHLAHLAAQPFFFARKIAPEATHLLARLGERTAAPETDLSYFEQVGRPTADYQSFLARATHARAARGKLATGTDTWRGLMEFNTRPYYLLCCFSPGYLQALVETARQSAVRPIFDDLFAPGAPVAAREVPVHYGFQASLRSRRDLDPAGFLHELVQADPQAPSALVIDAARDDWLRGFAVWDRLATVVLCDPPGLSYPQRAAAGLPGMAARRSVEALPRLIAAVEARQWLPREFFHQALEEKKHHCSVVRLHDLQGIAADPTLEALRQALPRVDPAPHYPGEAASLRLLAGQPEPLS